MSPSSELTLESDMVTISLAFERLLTANRLNQNPPHGLSDSRKEVATTVPMLHFVGIHQPREAF